jgi:hypothetical protein
VTPKRSAMIDPTGYVARFVRERPIAFDEAMASSPIEHLVEFWNWLDEQGLLAHHPTARAEVVMVGDLEADDDVLAVLEQPGPMALLRTDEEGARVLASALSKPIEFRMRLQRTKPEAPER